jgi:glycerate 2-kinase
MTLPDRTALQALAERAIAAVHPSAVLPDAIRAAFAEAPVGRTWVFGAGKAAAQMAAAFEASYDWPVSGLVITRYGFGCPLRDIELVEAAHPVPDDAGLIATQRMMAAIANVAPTDRVVFLLSGGASALLSMPVAGLKLDTKRDIIRQLVLSGADISQINTVRRALSAVKNGRLAALCPAPVTTFAISDVVGDDPATIGSGPTFAGPVVDAAVVASILSTYCSPELAAQVQLPEQVPSAMRNDRYILVASAAQLIAAARAELQTLGIASIVERTQEQGDVGAVAKRHAALIGAHAGSAAMALVSGGELTVSINAEEPVGVGGPNQDYALHLAMAIDPAIDFSAIAIDTDGIDGAGGAAGGYVNSATLERAAARTIDVGARLRVHDSQPVLSELSDLIVTGPTGTNVNDLRIVLARR